GFIGVDLTHATLTLDPDAAVEFTFLDPGTGNDADGKIRIAELSPEDDSSLIDVKVKGDPGDGVDDVVLDGTFAVSVLPPVDFGDTGGGDEGEEEEPTLAPAGAATRTELFDVNAQLHWADLSDPANVTITADATSKLTSFFSVNPT